MVRDDIGRLYLWNKVIEKVAEEQESAPAILPIPVISIIEEPEEYPVLKISNTSTGYPSGTTFRYSIGNEPTATDEIVPSDGVSITQNGTVYVRAFPSGEGNILPSPSVMAEVGFEYIELQTPVVSASRLDATSCIITLTNWQAYPEGTSIKINGTSNSPSAAYTLTVTDQATTFTIQAVYSGDSPYEPTSETATTSIDEYLYIPTATPTFSRSGLTVSISCETPGATIYYHLSDSDVWVAYSDPLVINYDCTLYAYAKAPGYEQSETASLVLVIPDQGEKLPTPEISIWATLDTDVEDNAKKLHVRWDNWHDYDPYIEISDRVLREWDWSDGYNDAVETIFLETHANGTTPVDTWIGFKVTDSSGYYQDSDEWTMSESETQSILDGVKHTVPSPTISYTSGNGYATISCSLSGATIYYRVGTSGSYSTISNGGSVSLSESSYVYAYATKSGYNQSGTTSRYCSFPRVSTPSISFNSSTNTVTITCSTSGANIYYRKGASGSYTRYSGSFTIGETTTIYAYATRSGYEQSSTMSRTCTVTTPKCATPDIQVREGGNNTVQHYMSIYCDTPQATIHYTYKTNKTSGSVSGTSREGYPVSSVLIGNDLSSYTVTAYATAPGYTQSDTATDTWPW